MMSNYTNIASQPSSISTHVTEETKKPFYRNFFVFPAILKLVCLVSKKMSYFRKIQIQMFSFQFFELCGFICALCSTHKPGSVKFFHGIILIALISTVLWFLLYLIQRNRRSHSIFLLKIEMYFHGAGSLILLLASSIIIGHSDSALKAASVSKLLHQIAKVILKTMFSDIWLYDGDWFCD